MVHSVYVLIIQPRESRKMSALTTLSVNSTPQCTVQTIKRETRGRPRRPFPTEQELAEMSKQNRWYYRHQEQELQKDKDEYYKNKQVKEKEYICFPCNIRNKIWELLRKEKSYIIDDKARKEYISELMRDTFFHRHGAGKTCIYNVQKPPFWCHLPMQIFIYRTVDDKLSVSLEEIEGSRLPMITGRQLSLKICHALGFEWGTSIIWHEFNTYTNKIVAHTVSFDGSGLDLSHEGDLIRLQECACETGLKGTDMLIMFANRNSINGYLQVWKGNKLILTSDTESALKAYRKDFNLN